MTVKLSGKKGILTEGFTGMRKKSLGAEKITGRKIVTTGKVHKKSLARLPQRDERNIPIGNDTRGKVEDRVHARKRLR